MALASEISIAKTNSARAFNKRTQKAFAEAEKTEQICSDFYTYFRRQDKETQKNTIDYLTSIHEDWNSKPLAEQVVEEIVRDDSGDYTVQAITLKEMHPGGF